MTGNGLRKTDKDRIRTPKEWKDHKPGNGLRMNDKPGNGLRMDDKPGNGLRMNDRSESDI